MKIAIIGAGLSGIVAAAALQSKLGSKADVTLFEKSRGAGGRMSTRRTEAFEFDHGAQYFTAKDAGFKKVVEEAIAKGRAAPWDGTAKYLKDGCLEADIGAPRFVSTPRMNSWAKSLAEGLTIKTQTRVLQLSALKNPSGTMSWQLTFEDGGIAGGFDYVISAIPAPQAEDLLSPTDFCRIKAIKDTRMDACFAVMAGFDEALDLPWHTLRRGDGPASWIAVNSAKPGRPKSGTALMIHSGPNWSAANVARDISELQSEILRDVSALIDIDFRDATFLMTHRWLYAAVSKGAGEACLADVALGIVACGDWCVGGRVEGAYLSGTAAANKIIDWAA